MTERAIGYWETSFRTAIEQELVGTRVIKADENTGTLTLSNGTTLQFDKDNSDCCSWIELRTLSTTDHVITSAQVTDTDAGEGGYTASITVITEAGELNILEAEADASNGYYLHGFALSVTIRHPEGPTEEELAEVRRILGVDGG